MFSQLLDFIDKDVIPRNSKHIRRESLNQLAIMVMAIVQKKMTIGMPIYEMLQLASVSLTETTPLNKLLGNPNYNIVNELDGSAEPTLFDC